ncbi:MAG: competence protein CoiA family protein [Promethearchaeota archaeon]|jgi:competence CoiA-like predicted nuclease
MKYKLLNYLIPKIESKSESFAHKVIKQLLFKKVLENNSNITEASLEKYFESRRADVYFKFNSGQEVVVEIQNSPITSKEITARTKDYNNRGIYVLWILYGEGRCVGSPKKPKHAKNKKISPAEIRLHQLYRGRVYYVNIKYKEDKITTTLPFGLHFTNSDNIAPILFRKRFESFFVRNVNFTYIPNWNLLCTSYHNYKIARFYDQNIRNVLIEDLRDFAKRNNFLKNQQLNHSKRTKKVFKLISTLFRDEYGQIFIINALRQLIRNKELILKEKFLNKYEKKLKRKAKTKIKKLHL